MEHALQVRILKELLEQIETGKNVDAGVQYKMNTDVYVCPEVAAKEREVFFQNHPQLIGLSGDLPEPNTWFTIDDFGVPVLATRDKEGNFKAFLNACRHRGARLTKDTRGKGNRFICPFHAWTYSTSGELLGIPQRDHFGPLNDACDGLIQLPTVEHRGMLWVHPKPDGELDIPALLGPLDEEVITYDFARWVYSGETVIEMNLNWKLANDTFGETYHFQKLHKDTLGQLFYGDNLSYEVFGRNHRFVFANKGIDMLRDVPESEWTLDASANLLYFLFPNVQMNIGGSNISLIKMYPHPTDPGKSLTRISFYFTPEMIELAASVKENSEIQVVDASNVYDEMDPDMAPGEEVAFTLEAITEVFSSTIADQDYVMGEQQQAAAQSGLLPHVWFGRNEPALHHYHNTFREALGMPPLEPITESVDS